MQNNKRSLAAHLAMASSYWGCNVSVGAVEANFFEGFPENLRNMLLGMRKYQAHEYRAEPFALDTLWTAGQVCVKSIQGYAHRAEYPTLLLIPSLINKSYILDLLPKRSMLRFMAEQKINTYLLDWGNSRADEGQQSVEALVMERLVPALKFLAQHGGTPIHALGYCMGGTLLAGAAVHTGAYLKSLTFLGTPWNFHGGGKDLLKRVEFWAPSAFPLMEGRRFLPLDSIQSLFASLDPEMTAVKFAKFLGMEEGSDEEQLFIAVEDWLGDGVDLPLEIAQHCIEGWFLKNQTYQGGWRVGGALVHPEEINAPALVVASDQDRLVEYECAAALHDVLPNSELLNPSCGHIAMIAGGKSIENVWQPIAQWLGRQC